ncbi:lactonase family protein [Streptomyces sp. LX-29]|uniref:lactonase family protein n=1 Tax=Streptomyces sp. LX-29 TaxID=2900152 RepID=UPI00240E25DB|nr:lactonase family protein [Streptomyces sp. LX-29]WFB06462.1 lactonase family protein [Streptomyces sp. LX-29]
MCEATSDRRAYIGSFTSAGGDGITVAAVDPDTGALTALHTTKPVPDPSHLALSPMGDVLYAVSETTDGGAVALSLGFPDRPVPLGPAVRVRGDAPTHLALAAGHLLTANYGSAGVTVLPVRAEGRLADPAAVLRHEGGGPHPERQRAPHPHAVVPDPSGRWVLGVDLGTDAVRVYALDAFTGSLSVHREAALRPGSGPRHLAFHPRGDLAYVVHELDSTVTSCRWNPAAGELRPVDEVRLLPADTEVPNHPSGIVVSPDGRFAWAANRGHDSLAVLALDPTDGAPSLVATVPCGGHWPRALTVDASGRHLYVANERSGDVTWFAVDPATGVPERAGSLPVPAASCVVLN